jgi:DNA-binding transcriptional MerR regulator
LATWLGKLGPRSTRSGSTRTSACSRARCGPASGRRTYIAADVRRLSFIRHGRSLGFSVDEIRSLLALSDQPERDCGEAAAIARQHLRDIEERIARLQTLRSALVGVAASCDGGRAADCHVIEAIAGVALPAPD